jgi:putative transposase
MADLGFFERRARRLTRVSRFKLQYEALCGQSDAAPKPIREIANERRRAGYRRLATPLK